MGTRALVAAVVTGVLVGFSIGGAYWAGGMAQAATQHQRVTRLATAADGAFSESAFQQAASRMDPGALAVARRHDPFTVPGAAARDRQAALFAARLERRDDRVQLTSLGGDRFNGAQLIRTGMSVSFNPAAEPFRMVGALEASRDLDCLTQAVYYEARGESAAGQRAVAQVVLNRARHPAYPKSICGVVFQGAYGGGTCQFSFACDGSMRARRDGGAWTRARGVAARALSGEVMSTVGNATSFHTTAVSPPWGARMMRVGQVGLHIFYRFGGRTGAPGAFSREPDRSTPESISRPIYTASADPTITADGKSGAGHIYAASAITVAPGPIPVAGAGGPMGAAPEPASAPVAEAARPAADVKPATATAAAS